MSAELLLLAGGAAAAGLVQGISGFAFGMVAMSVWVWGLPPQVAVVMSVFGGLTGQVFTAVTTRRFAPPRMLLPFLIGGLAGLPLGVYILHHIDPAPFKLVLGIVLVVFCSATLLAEQGPKVSVSGPLADGAVGVLGGVIGGVSSFTGLAPSLWCVIRGYDKDLARALLQNFNLAALAATLTAFIVTGAVTLEMAAKFPVVALALVIPSLIGGRIYKGLSPLAFRRVILALLLCAGVVMLGASASQMWPQR